MSRERCICKVSCSLVHYSSLNNCHVVELRICELDLYIRALVFLGNQQLKYEFSNENYGRFVSKPV